MAELDFNCRLTSGFARSLHNWTATNASIDIRTISFKRYISLAYIIGTFYHIGQLNRHNTRQYSSTIPSQPRVFLDPFAGHSTPLSMTVGALDHFTPLNTEHNRESKCYILNDVIYLTLHQLTFTGVVGVNWVSTFLQTVHSKRLRKYDRGRKSSLVRNLGSCRYIAKNLSSAAQDKTLPNGTFISSLSAEYPWKTDLANWTILHSNDFFKVARQMASLLKSGIPPGAFFQLDPVGV